MNLYKNIGVVSRAINITNTADKIINNKRVNVDYKNPYHKEYLKWYWMPFAIVLVPLILCFIFPPMLFLMPVGIVIFATSKERKIAFALENLQRATELGNIKQIKKYSDKAKKILDRYNKSAEI